MQEHFGNLMNLARIKLMALLLVVVYIAVVRAYHVGDHGDQCVKPIRILKNSRWGPCRWSGTDSWRLRA